MRPRRASTCSSACSCVIRSFLTSFATWPCVTSRAFCSPASTKRWSTSLSTTGTSADAMTWAISPPMVPAPTTAALNTNIPVLDSSRRWGKGAEGYVTDPRGYGSSAMGDFAIERFDDTVQVHLRVKGDLDLYNAPAFDDALVAVEGEKWPTLVLDLRELDFLDSMALRLIMRTQARATQDGRRLALVGGPALLGRGPAAGRPKGAPRARRRPAGARGGLSRRPGPAPPHTRR